MQALFSTRNLPIRYISFLKCGSAQILNLLYLLDNDKALEQPHKIHSIKRNFLRVSDIGLSPSEVAQEEHAFAVMRHPTKRLTSLYFDKVLGNRYLPVLRERLLENHQFDLYADNQSAHLKNCFILADVLEYALAAGEMKPHHFHWLPQTTRIRLLKDCRLKILLLEDLNTHLDVLLRDIVPNIATQLTRLNAQNSSKKPLPANDLMHDELISRVRQVYPRDHFNYTKAANTWRKLNINLATNADVPRFNA